MLAPVVRRYEDQRRPNRARDTDFVNSHSCTRAHHRRNEHPRRHPARTQQGPNHVRRNARRIAAQGPTLGEILTPLCEHIALLPFGDVIALAEWMHVGAQTLGPMRERLQAALARG
jgi:hypothetical protein